MKSLVFKFRTLFFLCILLNPIHLTAQKTQSLSTIENKTDTLFSENQNDPGCVVGILKNGEILMKKGYGLANLDYDIPITPQTIFDIGSLSMHFTAACLVLLEAEGKLSLDDPIQKYITEFPTYKEGKITIRNLLNHTSGVREYFAVMAMSGQDYDIEFGIQSGLDILKQQNALCITPGSEYRFACSNYLLSAIIVERASGISYPEFINQNLFNPAEMYQTFVYKNHKKVVKNQAVGYAFVDEQFEKNHPAKFTSYGDGRIYTNLEDFFKWIAFLKTKKVGKKVLFDHLAMRGTLNDKTPMTYSLGLEHGNLMGHPLVGHNGYWAGFNSMYLDFPDRDLAVVTMANNSTISAPSKAYQIAEMLLENVPPTTRHNNEQNPESVTLSNEKLKAFCGHYFNEKFAYVRSIYLKNDTLRYVINENRERNLIPISESNFRIIAGNFNIILKFDEEKNLTIFINDNEPQRYYPFEKTEYSNEDLKQFEGKYYSKQLDVEYEVKVDNKHLKTYLGEREMGHYSTVAESLFNSHDQFLKFEKGKWRNDYKIHIK